MRPKGMNKRTVPLATMIVVLSGCGTQSASTSATTTSPLPAATTRTGTPPSTSPTTGTAAAGTAVVPAAATQATLSYVGPVAVKRLRVTKTVTGAAYQRLAEDLNALKPQAGTMECMVVSGETASITLAANGHSFVFTVEGVPCRGVMVSKDGVAQARLANTMTLVNQVRAIAGFTGMAHPLTG